MRTALAVVLAVSVLPASGRAARVTTAVLWVGAPGAAGGEAAALVEAALASSAVVAPIADAEARRLLVEGGPATQARQRLEAARERFAARGDVAGADALLAEAESSALGVMETRAVCPLVREVARLRLRLAELARDRDRGSAAAVLLSACAPDVAGTPSGDDAAAIARHPPQRPRAAPPLRVESDPPGAEVLVDLKPIGRTPIDLPATRRPGALLDVERPGFRKVHRVLDDARGTLALTLARDDGLPALLDRVRAGSEASEPDVAELARRVGAAQLLAMRAGRPGVLDLRLFDTARGAWVKPASELAASLPSSLDRAALLAYVAPASAPSAAHPQGAAATTAAHRAAVVAAGPGAAGGKKPVPLYKRWYTWVVGGVLIAGVAAYVIAGHVGDDQVTVHVER